MSHIEKAMIKLKGACLFLEVNMSYGEKQDIEKLHIAVKGLEEAAENVRHLWKWGMATMAMTGSPSDRVFDVLIPRGRARLAIADALVEAGKREIEIREQETGQGQPSEHQLEQKLKEILG